jgi:putative membrane protein
MFGAGLLTLWLCLDWPVGALGAGYLLSVHSGQYVVLSYVAIPLLLLGIPAENLPIRGGAGGWLLRRLTHAGLGLGIYAAAMGVTHLPAVVDPLMRTQAGSFGIDLVWIVGALSLWWPVVAPPGYVRMSPPVRIGYLFLATIPPTIPAAFMVFADYPLYAVYELAPRVGGISAAADQQVAGVLMKAAADPLLWIAMAIVFFTWQRTDPDGDDAPPASQETFS